MWHIFDECICCGSVLVLNFLNFRVFAVIPRLNRDGDSVSVITKKYIIRLNKYYLYNLFRFKHIYNNKIFIYIFFKNILYI